MRSAEPGIGVNAEASEGGLPDGREQSDEHGQADGEPARSRGEHGNQHYHREYLDDPAERTVCIEACPVCAEASEHYLHEARHQGDRTDCAEPDKCTPPEPAGTRDEWT